MIGGRGPRIYGCGERDRVVLGRLNHPLRWVPGLGAAATKPLSKSKVKIGPHDAYRRVFQHRNGEGQTEIIIRYYFLAGSYLYQVNGFMLPPQRGTVESLVDGLARSIVTNP